MSIYAKNEVQRQREQQLAVSIAQHVNILDSKEWLLAETKKRLYNLDSNPLRKEFLDRYFAFTKEHGIEIKKIPVVAKMPLDLFKLYVTVMKHGGLAQVVKQRCWNVIVREIGLPITITSAAYTLREKYYRLLYPFEKYEREMRQDPLIRNGNDSMQLSNSNDESRLSESRPSERRQSENSLSGSRHSEIKRSDSEGQLRERNRFLSSNTSPENTSFIKSSTPSILRFPTITSNIKSPPLRSEMASSSNVSMVTSPMKGSAFRRISLSDPANHSVTERRVRYSRPIPQTMLKIVNIYRDRIELDFYSDGKRYVGCLPEIT